VTQMYYQIIDLQPNMLKFRTDVALLCVAQESILYC